MIITITNDTARAVFSAGSTVTTVDRGGGVTVELDAGGAVVAASFENHGGAVRLTKLLPSVFGLALSDQDVNDLLSTSV